MSKRPQPNSQDMWSQGDRNYGKVKVEPDAKGDSQNNTLEYFIEREKTIQLLKKKGIKNLYPIQQQTFRHIYKGEDIMARDRTGSGKTMAFVLPVIQRFRNAKFEHRYPKFLIILPTRELAIQVHNEIESLRYRDEDDFVSYVVYGKTSIDDNVRRMRDGVDILVATPGRLNDLIEKGSVRLDSIEVICLDEADEILKQGFKEEIEKVFYNMKKVNKNKVQVLLFSATIPPWLKGLSEEYQTRDRPYINLISDDQTRSSKTIKHLCCQISRFGGSEVVRLIEHMVEKYGGIEKRILIFCDRKAEVDDLSRDLSIPNQPLHGDVNQSRRERAYRDFKSGMLKCIVATNVAARGLDFPHVDLVIQMTPPINTEEYIHRSGRTGRAGKQGTCLTFFDRTKSRIISKIEDQARITIQKITVDASSLSGSRGGYERNDRYDRGGRQERGERQDRNDRFERNDRNDRNGGYERRDNGRGDRNDYQSGGNRYGDRDRQGSSNFQKQVQGNGRDFGRSNNYGGENRDPRPRSSYNNEGRDNRGSYGVSQQRNRSRSISGGKETARKNRSISNSRSVSKERPTSPRPQRSPSPRRQRSPSPRKDYGSRPVSRPSQNDDCDY